MDPSSCAPHYEGSDLVEGHCRLSTGCPAPCAISRALLKCPEGALKCDSIKSVEMPVLVKLNPLLEKKIRIRYEYETLISITVSG